MTDGHGHHRPSDDGQKWGTIVVGLLAIGISGWLTYESLDAHPAHRDLADGGVVASTLVGDGGPTTTNGTGPIIAVDAGSAMGSMDVDGGLNMAMLSLDASLLPSTSGPRAVKIGIVMVSFAGAEGAPNNARPKAAAKDLADKLHNLAEADFHKAVNGGDSGSIDDLGSIPRGTLDPPTESAVFSLKKDDVSGVIETPKGFWIVKRLD